MVMMIIIIYASKFYSNYSKANSGSYTQQPIAQKYKQMNKGQLTKI